MLRISPWRVRLSNPLGNHTARTFRFLAVSLIASFGLFGAVGATSVAGAVGQATSPAVLNQPTDGLLTGNAIIRNAPANFQGEVGVAVCPATATPGKICASPLFSLAQSGASYTIQLPAGAWEVREFYTIGYAGGAYIGRPRAISIVGGQTVRQNIAVRYQVPTALAGTVTVTGLPSGVSISDLVVTACPSSQPLTGGFPSIFCNSDYIVGSNQYSIPTLFKGHWLLYVGYVTVFGFTQLTVPTPVTLPRGGSVTADLSAAYQTPANGLLEATVTIAGAPAGFSPPLEGIGACPVVSGGSGSPCANPSYTFGGTTAQLVLSPGQWDAAGFYELAPFGGQFISPIQTVSVAAGVIDHVDFTITYLAPATVRATVAVTGLPAGVTVEDTQLLACPPADPYNGTNVAIECVETGSAGSGNVDTIATLPPGTWLLYPGYFASNGSFSLSTQATTVKLKSGRTKRVSLSVAFHP
jgi:hypothetical protein